MKRILILVFTLFSSAILSVAEDSNPKQSTCDLGITVNPQFSKADRLDSILKSYAPELLPGVSLAVYTESEGWWVTAAGYANVEEQTPMTTCHLQYTQSLSKTYMAVEILQLKEQGKLELDAPITKYLPGSYSQYIRDASMITVRMLLNQTSGIPEYNSHPDFVSEVILHPTENFSSEDCLRVIEDQDLRFDPGTKYAYTNTNYLLLSLIADEITGDHAAFIRKNIFDRLNLKKSFYDKGNGYLSGLNLPDSYWDVLNNGVPINITPFQQMTVACSKGDDGVVCTPVDAVLFLRGLMEGKLLDQNSMKEMMTFVKDEQGVETYGMGIFSIDLGGIPAYGHGGGGVGAGCALLHIPSHKVYCFIGTNLGVLIEGNLAAKADGIRNEVLGALIQ
jgi:D-alanyl-D-alanine carboxypeptidase